MSTQARLLKSTKLFSERVRNPEKNKYSGGRQTGSQHLFTSLRLSKEEQNKIGSDKSVYAEEKGKKFIGAAKQSILGFSS